MSPARQAGRSSRRPSAASSGARRSSELRSPLIRLQQDIASCTACASLTPWRQFTSTAYGTFATGYLIFGEAPGYRSWANGRRFTGPAGATLQPPEIILPVTETFRRWYQDTASAVFGSQFTFTQAFTITGDGTGIVSVTVILANQQGQSTPVTANLQ